MSVVHTSYFASPELKIDENTPFENKTITLNASVEFYVIGKLVDSSWIGIGFNKEKNQKMKGTDIIMGYFDEEKNIDVIKDFHATATIGTPKEDESQDLISPKLTKVDGFVMLQFKRNIVSLDKVSISVLVICLAFSFKNMCSESFYRRISIFQNHFTWFIPIVVVEWYSGI